MTGEATRCLARRGRSVGIRRRRLESNQNGSYSRNRRAQTAKREPARQRAQPRLHRGDIAQSRRTGGPGAVALPTGLRGVRLPSCVIANARAPGGPETTSPPDRDCPARAATPSRLGVAAELLEPRWRASCDVRRTTSCHPCSRESLALVLRGFLYRGHLSKAGARPSHSAYLVGRPPQGGAAR